MRKVMLTIVLVMGLFMGKAQDRSYAPYVSVGTGISGGQATVGGEVGIYNHTTWYSVGMNVNVGGKENYECLFVKGYWKISKHKAEQLVDIFASTAVNMLLTRYHTLSVEPGLNAVFNVTKKIAPQFTLSFPVDERVFRGRAPSMFAGISINYWL